jgi:hypothetical protein
MSQSDLNWQMTGFFLLALALLGFVMKLVALLQSTTASDKRSWIFWLILSPNSLGRLRPVVEPWRVLFQTALWFVAVCLSYSVYGGLLGVVHVHGLFFSYAALPILVLMTQFLVSLATVLWLPSGRLLPSIHHRLWLTRSLADFWGRRWNLWFSDWFRYAIFRPLRRRPVLALILIFAISGVMHEWVINVPLYFLTGRTLFGSMIVYFLLQAAGILLEHRFLKGHDVLRVGFAWLVVIAPAPLIMNEGLLRTLHLWPEQVAIVQTIADPKHAQKSHTTLLLELTP